MFRSKSRKVRRSFNRRSQRSKRTMKGGMNNRNRNVNNSNNKNGVSFAAKLAAFILEGLKNDPKLNGNDTNMQSEVSGAIPYLHMNISEKDVVSKFKDTQKNRVKGLTKICKKKKLETSLRDVKFNCKRQSTNGVVSINKSIVDSINNRWNIRKNGRKHLRKIAKYMVEQLKSGKIPKASLDWCNGGADISKF
jgi:hypothetical protein